MSGPQFPATAPVDGHRSSGDPATELAALAETLGDLVLVLEAALTVDEEIAAALPSRQELFEAGAAARALPLMPLPAQQLADRARTLGDEASLAAQRALEIAERLAGPAPRPTDSRSGVDAHAGEAAELFATAAGLLDDAAGAVVAHAMPAASCPTCGQVVP
ncbi:MAG TPA: hypothetical protein VGV93_10475 [Acidimicrobiales bacterium]|nr:hypothetical protein [Acidimicrobiales bacterium]